MFSYARQRHTDQVDRRDPGCPELRPARSGAREVPGSARADRRADGADPDQDAQDRGPGRQNGYGTSAANHARHRAANNFGGGSVRAADGGLSLWPGFFGMAGLGPTAERHLRQGTAWAHRQSRTSRYPPHADRGRYVSIELAGERTSIPDVSWLARLLVREPRMLVAIALANKMARAIWAMLPKGQDYRDPIPAAAA